MDDKKNTREFINPHAFEARGMKNADGTPAPEDGRVYTIVGPVNNIQVGKTKNGDTLVRVRLQIVMLDNTLKYLYPQAQPNADHTVQVSVALLKDRAERFLKFPPLLGQSVLVEVQKPQLNTFSKRDGTNGFEISGIAGNIALVPETRFYTKKAAGNEKLYELHVRQKMDMYDFSGNKVDNGNTAAPAQSAPASRGANIKTEQAPEASKETPPGIFTIEDFDDDDMPF